MSRKLLRFGVPGGPETGLKGLRLALGDVIQDWSEDRGGDGIILHEGIDIVLTPKAEGGVQIDVERRQPGPTMRLAWNDADPQAICACGWTTTGDAIVDAVVAWARHVAEAHREDW